MGLVVGDLVGGPMVGEVLGGIVLGGVVGNELGVDVREMLGGSVVGGMVGGLVVGEVFGLYDGVWVVAGALDGILPGDPGYARYVSQLACIRITCPFVNSSMQLSSV